MNLCVYVTLCLFVGSIHADFAIVYQSPNATVVVHTQNFSIQINQTVNPPQFSALIQVYNVNTSTVIAQIDVCNNSNVTYSNNTLIFYLPDSIYNGTTGFYITFGVGVLFSNVTNSTTQNTSQFWSLTVVSLPTTTSITSTSSYTSMGTTSSMTSTGTSAFTTMSTYTSTNQTTQTLSTTTTVIQAKTGEPPPTRSAQLGMGLGITFISIVIIIEIIYFKYCYTSNGRAGSYYT